MSGNGINIRMGGWAVNQVAPRIGMIRPELIAKSVQDFFMRSPMQRKYAAKAAHGGRGEQGKKPPLLDCADSHMEVCCC